MHGVSDMKFAFVFPGQGSQAVGMLDVWAVTPSAQAVMSEADAALNEASIRLTKPLNTLPGPHSTMCVTPCWAIASMV